MKRSRQALLIVHKHDSDPARVGAIYPNMDSALAGVVRICGDPLPSVMEEHDMVVLFGGPQSANDAETADASDRRAELDLIPTKLD